MNDVEMVKYLAEKAGLKLKEESFLDALRLNVFNIRNENTFKKVKEIIYETNECYGEIWYYFDENNNLLSINSWGE